MTNENSKQKLDDIRRDHISKCGLEHWENIVGEQVLRTHYMDYKGMTRALMDSLIFRVADVRLDEYVGFQGLNLDLEILDRGHDASAANTTTPTDTAARENQIICTLCSESSATSVQSMMYGPLVDGSSWGKEIPGL